MNEKKSRPKSQIMMSPPQQHPNCSSSRKPGCDSLPSHRYENEWEIKERELAEARARASQMEKTMRWWSDCTANWREKWSLVRNERNQAREELRIAKMQLDEACKQMAILRGDPRAINEVGILTLSSSIPSTSSTFSSATTVVAATVTGNPKGIPHPHHSHSTINSYAQTDKMDKNKIASLEKQVTMLTLKLEESNRAIVFEREEKMILHRSIERLQRDVSDLQELYDNLKKELLISELLDKDDHEMSESVEVDIEEADADDDIIDGSHPDPYNAAMESSLEQVQHESHDDNNDTTTASNSNNSYSQNRFHDSNENEFSESSNIDRLINDSTSMESEILQIIEASEKIFDSIFAETNAVCESKLNPQDKDKDKESKQQLHQDISSSNVHTGTTTVKHDAILPADSKILETETGFAEESSALLTQTETQEKEIHLDDGNDNGNVKDNAGENISAEVQESNLPVLDTEMVPIATKEENGNKTDEKECDESSNEVVSTAEGSLHIVESPSTSKPELKDKVEIQEIKQVVQVVELVLVDDTEPEPGPVLKSEPSPEPEKAPEQEKAPEPELVLVKDEKADEIKETETFTALAKASTKSENKIEQEIVTAANSTPSDNIQAVEESEKDKTTSETIVETELDKVKVTAKVKTETPEAATEEKKREKIAPPVEKKFEEIICKDNSKEVTKKSNKSSPTTTAPNPTPVSVTSKDKNKSKKDNDKHSGSDTGNKRKIPKPTKTKAK